MRAKGKPSGVADEGGLWPDFSTNEEALATLTRAIELSGAKAPDDIGIAIDVAATSFQDRGGYRLIYNDTPTDFFKASEFASL